ncbi:MAG: hypothetical protein AAF714_12645 [Pseudomonadota bacterium]
MRRLCLLLPFLIAGCATFPELDGVESPDTTDAAFLDFLTVDELVALNAAPPAGVASADLTARLSRLRARAAVLRGPIFSGADRQRLSGTPG